MENRSSKHKKYSVLVIDDQDNWRELLTELLQNQFDVVNVNSYEGALDAIRNQLHPFHVVVTDMRLVDGEPGNEDGLKLAEYLNIRGDETKIIVVTGYPTFATQKHALSTLAAYDYLEKKPSDGSPFNPQDFQKKVYQAAQEAESLRLEGFNDMVQNILILESDLEWAEKLKDILVQEGYNVDLIQDAQNLEKQLDQLNREYALFLINEHLSKSETLATVQRLYPNTNVILLTSKEVGNIFNTMREYPVLTALAVSGDQFNVGEFRDVIHSALSTGAKKYVSIMAASDHPDQIGVNKISLAVDTTCKLNLSIHDAPAQGALPVLLLPGEKKRKKVRLHLFVHAKNMKVEPSSEMYWDIPLSDERPERFEFTITPKELGENALTIEIDQNQRWLGRISVNFIVQKKNK